MLKPNKIHILLIDDNSKHLAKEIETLKSLLDITTTSKLIKHLIYNYRKSLNNHIISNKKIPLIELNQFLKKYE